MADPDQEIDQVEQDSRLAARELVESGDFNNNIQEIVDLTGVSRDAVRW